MRASARMSLRHVGLRAVRTPRAAAASLLGGAQMRTAVLPAMIAAGPRGMATSSELGVPAGGFGMWVDNQWTSAAGGAMMEVLAPRDGKLLTTVAAATAEDVERAVSSAAACFANPEWSGPAGASKRAGVLRAAASLLREPARRTALAELESADCGKPIREAEADMDVCAA